VPNETAVERVGLNAHLLSLTQSYRGAGINGYIFRLLAHLPAMEQPAGRRPRQYVAYLHDRAFDPPAGLAVARSRWDTASPWRRIAWEQTALARAAQGLELLHGLAFVTPAAAACPTVVTVHDLSFVRFPEAFRPFNRNYLNWATRMSVRRAARVIAVSECTRRDVIDLLGVAPERVVTVPNGVGAEFGPAPAAQVEAFRRQAGLPERFILYVGTLEPRKNLERLVDAYAAWRSRTSSPAPLVIGGGKGWFYRSIFARVQALGLEEQVLFPGFIPAEALPWWYRAAALFVYPSRFEGFGLPVLEAMASGTPVVTSTAGALAEVAGDAALAADPDDTAGLAGAIERALAEPDLAAQMAAAGLRRAAGYSWERTARETAAVYDAVLDRHPGETQ
jgi:glycosyltransferase involved in cell wall biosynthesis